MDLYGWPLPQSDIGWKVHYEKNTEKQTWWYLLCLTWICNSSNKNNTVLSLMCYLVNFSIFIPVLSPEIRRCLGGQQEGKIKESLLSLWAQFFNVPLIITVTILFFTDVFWNKTETLTDLPNCFSIQLTYFIHMSCLPERNISIFEPASREQIFLSIKKTCILKYKYMHIHAH